MCIAVVYTVVIVVGGNGLCTAAICKIPVLGVGTAVVLSIGKRGVQWRTALCGCGSKVNFWIWFRGDGDTFALWWTAIITHS